MGSLNRREALQVLGLGSAALAAAPRAALAQSPAFPNGAIIRTLFKDYAPADLAGGATLFHEHLSLGPDFMDRFRAAAAAVLATLGIVATAPAQTSTQRLIEAQEKAATRTPSMAASPRIVLDAGFTMPKGSQIDAYGDSMMVGSVPALRYYFPGIRIDAKSNRRWSAGLAAIMASGHDIRRGVILSFGTNAGVEETDLRAILDRLGPKRMVVLVNIHLNMARTARDNATLARVAGDYANVIVADWNGALARATGALQPDGIHPSMTGQHVYAATIRQAFADLSERHTGKVVKLKKLPIP